jgi:hypothetical protein
MGDPAGSDAPVAGSTDATAAGETGSGVRRPTRASAATAADGAAEDADIVASIDGDPRTAANSSQEPRDARRRASLQASLGDDEVVLSPDAEPFVSPTDALSTDSSLAMALDPAADSAVAVAGGADSVDIGQTSVLDELPSGSPLLAALSAAELAYLLEQCGPHPDPSIPGCDRDLTPIAQPTAAPEPPLIETAGSQFAPEPASPASVVQSAANAVVNLVTSGLAHTGAGDLTLVVAGLVLLLVLGLGVRRLGRNPSRTTPLS